MKILVTGGNGLVGSNVSSFLKQKHTEYKVFTSGRADTDLFNYQDTKNLLNDVKPDLLINCAAKVGGIHANNTKRTQFILENLKINTNLLEAAITHKKMKIINLGSSCIYPLDAPNPINEESFMNGLLEPTNSPYAMAKLTAIELGRAMAIEHGHSIINLMPTNLYGPNDNFSPIDGHVIPGLMYRMHMSKESKKDVFKIWGTGKPLREFLYVEDFADAIKFLIGCEWSEDLINIGSGKEISIKELAEVIKKIVGYEGNLQFDNSKPDGNPRKLLDSSLIFNKGWKPKTSLVDGLTKTYNWMTNNIENIRF